DTLGKWDFAQGIAGRWKSAFTTMGDVTSSFSGKVGSIASKVGNAIPDGLVNALSKGGSKITAIATKIGGSLSQFGSLLLGPWGLAIAAVVAGLAYFFTQTELGREVFQKL